MMIKKIFFICMVLIATCTMTVADPIFIEEDLAFVVGADQLIVYNVSDDTMLIEPSITILGATDIVIRGSKAFVRTVQKDVVGMEVVDVSSYFDTNDPENDDADDLDDLEDTYPDPTDCPGIGSGAHYDSKKREIDVFNVDLDGKLYDLMFAQRGASNNWEITSMTEVENIVDDTVEDNDVAVE